MRKAIHLMIAAAVAGLAAACGEGTAPASGQADVLAAEADQLGAMVDTDFGAAGAAATAAPTTSSSGVLAARSEEHTSELQSHSDLVCRLLLEKKKNKKNKESLHMR